MMEESEQNFVLKHVEGDILNPTRSAEVINILLHCVDDSGVYGSGGLFDLMKRKYPSILDAYENIPDLSKGQAHIVINDVLNGTGSVVIFLIAQDQNDRSHIEQDVFESSMKNASELVKTFPNASVNLPKIGYGTDLNWNTVEQMIERYFLRYRISCTVFHYKRPARPTTTARRPALRLVDGNGDRDRSESPLPAKRARKPIVDLTRLDNDDRSSSSSSSAESSEGEYEPSDIEDKQDPSSSDSSLESDDEEEEIETEDDVESEDEYVDDRYKKPPSRKPFPIPEVKPKSEDSFNGAVVSLFDVPEDLLNEYMSFIQQQGGEVVTNEDDLKKATVSVVYNLELLQNAEKLDEFRLKFDNDCLQVTSNYLDDLIADVSDVNIHSYVL